MNFYKNIVLIAIASLAIVTSAQENTKQEISSETNETIIATPLVESIGHNTMPWTFKYSLPIEKKAMENAGRLDGYLLYADGAIEVFDQNNQLLQSIPTGVALTTNRLVKNNDAARDLKELKFFWLHDYNNDGWKDLIIENDFDSNGPLMVHEFYQFNPKQKQFIKVDQMSNRGSIEPYKKNCAKITHKKDAMSYRSEIFCYQKKNQKWVLTQTR